MSWLCRASAECVKNPEVLNECEYFKNHGLTQFNPKNDFSLDATPRERYRVCGEIIGRLNVHLRQAEKACKQEQEARVWVSQVSVVEAGWDDCGLELIDLNALENRMLCVKSAVQKLERYQQKLRDKYPWTPFRIL